MGVHIWELLVILVVALLLFGPGRIGGIGKALGKSINEFKKELKGDKSKVEESEKQEQSDTDAQ